MFKLLYYFCVKSFFEFIKFYSVLDLYIYVCVCVYVKRIGKIPIYNQLTLSERDYSLYTQWAQFNLLKGFKSKSEVF